MGWAVFVCHGLCLGSNCCNKIITFAHPLIQSQLWRSGLNLSWTFFGQGTVSCRMDVTIIILKWQIIPINICTINANVIINFQFPVNLLILCRWGQRFALAFLILWGRALNEGTLKILFTIKNIFQHNGWIYSIFTKMLLPMNLSLIH